VLRVGCVCTIFQQSSGFRARSVTPQHVPLLCTKLAHALSAARLRSSPLGTFGSRLHVTQMRICRPVEGGERRRWLLDTGAACSARLIAKLAGAGGIVGLALLQEMRVFQGDKENPDQIVQFAASLLRYGSQHLALRSRTVLYDGLYFDLLE
jgi:hypothetical protein